FACTARRSDGFAPAAAAGSGVHPVRVLARLLVAQCRIKLEKLISWGVAAEYRLVRIVEQGWRRETGRPTAADEDAEQRVSSPRPTQVELTEPRTDGRNSTTLTVPCRQQQQQEKHQHPDSAELLGCRCKTTNDDRANTQTQLPQSSASRFHTRVRSSNAERQNLKSSATSPDSDVGADAYCNLSKRYARPHRCRALRTGVATMRCSQPTVSPTASTSAKLVLARVNDLVGAGRLLTAVDSLDTLLVMGLGAGVPPGARDLLRRTYHPADLTTAARMLGGLLAYSLTEDPIFARKAAELGNSMAGSLWSPGRGRRRSGQSVRTDRDGVQDDGIDGESGRDGLSVPGVRLPVRGVTGDPKYARWARLNQANPYAAVAGEPQTAYSAGAEGDSFYEYLCQALPVRSGLAVLDRARLPGAASALAAGRPHQTLWAVLGCRSVCGKRRSAVADPACLITNALDVEPTRPAGAGGAEQHSSKGRSWPARSMETYLLRRRQMFRPAPTCRTPEAKDWAANLPENITRACYLRLRTVSNPGSVPTPS
uniref:alpha-1,2-Mannosidase n=1 Tax=Macrostomum lignano TaxID=282301 RepID=A0A1I8F6C2_9PLAT